jgi:hypothetical protein
MKVKKIGSIEEETPVRITQPVRESVKTEIIQPEKTEIVQPVKTESVNKTKYYIIGVILIIASLSYYIFVFQNQGDSKTTDNQKLAELKNKELELKERELKQKEQEQQKKETVSQEQKFNINTPEGVVVKFIESLGKRDFSAAFALMTEKRRGSYNTFTSTKGYGGITSTKIISCAKTGQIDNKYEVMVSYESIDPANKSGKFNQYFYLIPFNDSFLISEIKNINIQWYE